MDSNNITLVINRAEELFIALVNPNPWVNKYPTLTNVENGRIPLKKGFHLSFLGSFKKSAISKKKDAMMMPK